MLTHADMDALHHHAHTDAHPCAVLPHHPHHRWSTTWPTSTIITSTTRHLRPQPCPPHQCQLLHQLSSRANNTSGNTSHPHHVQHHVCQPCPWPCQCPHLWPCLCQWLPHVEDHVPQLPAHAHHSAHQPAARSALDKKFTFNIWREDNKIIQQDFKAFWLQILAVSVHCFCFEQI